MNIRVALLSVVAVDFAAMTAYTLATQSVSEILAPFISSPAGMMGAFDVLIALSLICLWMVQDARSRGVSVWPFLLVTATTGSLGPLLYLIQREWGVQRTFLSAAGPVAA